MKVLSLFTGIGGLDIGLGEVEHVGMVEAEPFCRDVLALRFPGVPLHDDVRTFTPDGEVDGVVGGFPCQDISHANANGRGLAGARSGLWFQMLRIVRQSNPRFVLAENVSRLERKGLATVAGGLRELGYRVGAVGMARVREVLGCE